jgi:vacuolar-type H+-ATPase subunit E/Vma4
VTIQEKLEHFQSFCLQDARTQSAKLLDDYKEQLERDLNDHKEEANRRAKMRLQLESEKTTHEINKELAIGQIQLRRTVDAKQHDLKDKLFSDVRGQLEAFFATPAYTKLLRDWILQAKDVAGGSDLVVYIDPADADKLSALAYDTGAHLKVSEYPFGRGARAVIPQKNILIDNSFDEKLAEAQRTFQFHVVPKEVAHG